MSGYDWATLNKLDEVGLRCVAVNLAGDHPKLFQEILERVPIENGGRWDKAAYDARMAAELTSDGPSLPELDAYGDYAPERRHGDS